MAVLELTREAMDVAEMAARRNRIVDAAFRTGGIIALGGTVYLGWWLYRYFTDVNINLKQSIGSVVEQPWPPVDPWMASPDAYEWYAGEVVPTLKGDWLAAAKFSRLQESIDPETGAFTGYSGEYAWLKRLEVQAAKAGRIPPPVAQMHPVDRVASLIVDNKWYWGGVLGLAALPPIQILVDEARIMVKKHEGET